MRRVLLVTAAALGALFWGAGPAAAHPLLVQAAPAPGLVTPAAPDEVQLQFSEPTVAAGSSLQLSGPGGRRVATRPIVSSDGGRTLAVVPRGRLAPAVYRVRWSTLGADGHQVGG